MVDLVSGTVVDPLQFSATLSFPGSAEHLLESFSDANDLSSFLQRLPNEDNENEEVIASNIHSPAITPDSQLPQVDQNLENFNDQLLPRYVFFHNNLGKIFSNSIILGIMSLEIQRSRRTRSFRNCIKIPYLHILLH